MFWDCCLCSIDFFFFLELTKTRELRHGVGFGFLCLFCGLVEQLSYVLLAPLVNDAKVLGILCIAQRLICVYGAFGGFLILLRAGKGLGFCLGTGIEDVVGADKGSLCRGIGCR